MIPRDDRPWFIVVAASAGGIPALQTVLAGLPADTRAAVAIVQHRSPTQSSLLEAILARRASMAVVPATDGQPIKPGFIYVSRPDLHLIVGPGQRFEYIDGTKVRGLLSSANPLFESAARAFGDRTIAVVLTGSGMDATDGVQTVKAHGGIVLAQEPRTAAYDSMPASAIRTGAVAHVLPLDAIAPALVALVSGQPIDGAAA